MIPIEKQVTSLEPSQRLKELGVNQDSYWVWVHPFLAKDLEHFYDEDNKLWKLTPRQSLAPARVVRHIFASFTVAELGEMLPARLKTDYGSWTYLHITKLENSKEWVIDYNYLLDIAEIRESVEADARAKMLIWLIENKLVEAKKEDV